MALFFTVNKRKPLVDLWNNMAGLTCLILISFSLEGKVADDLSRHEVCLSMKKIIGGHVRSC